MSKGRFVYFIVLRELPIGGHVDIHCVAVRDHVVEVHERESLYDRFADRIEPDIFLST